METLRQCERERVDMWMTKNRHTVKNVYFMDFCSYLFWAYDNMYEFLLLFVLFHICSLLPFLFIVDLSMRCRARVDVSDRHSTICEQCHSHYVLLNSWIFEQFISFLFCSLAFFSLSFSFSLSHSLSLRSSVLCLLFLTSFYVTFDTLNGNGILHFIVIINARVNHIYHAPSERERERVDRLARW